MLDLHAYEYAILRLVPRVEREEFINIGVILYCKAQKFLQVKYHLPPDRIKACFQEINLNLLNEYLSAWDLICRGKTEGGLIATLDMASRFRWLTAPRSTMIQSSATHPGRCSDPNEIMERLFKQYVL